MWEECGLDRRCRKGTVKRSSLELIRGIVIDARVLNIQSKSHTYSFLEA